VAVRPLPYDAASIPFATPPQPHDLAAVGRSASAQVRALFDAGHVIDPAALRQPQQAGPKDPRKTVSRGAGCDG
jgi:hypothetical protein